MTRNTLLGLALAAIWAGGVFAHPMPRAATPAPAAVLAAGPGEIRITFSEGLVAAFSGLELRNAKGVAVAMGPATVNPRNDGELIAPIRGALAPGTYTVDWHAVGIDTHHVAGRYSFRVE